MENTTIFCPFSSGKYYKILYAYFSFYKQMTDNSKVLQEELQELSQLNSQLFHRLKNHLPQIRFN